MIRVVFGAHDEFLPAGRTIAEFRRDAVYWWEMSADANVCYSTDSSNPVYDPPEDIQPKDGDQVEFYKWNGKYKGCKSPCVDCADENRRLAEADYQQGIGLPGDRWYAPDGELMTRSQALVQLVHPVPDYIVGEKVTNNGQDSIV